MSDAIDITVPAEPANLERAAERGEVLWALEMDADRWPCQAHLIVSIETRPDGWPSSYGTACGRRMDVNLTGCWSTKAGDVPLDERAVHCTSTCRR